MVKKQLNLAGIISKYIDVPYKLGGKDLSGMDCLMMINSIGRELGMNIPDEFRGINEDSYSEFWTSSPDQAKYIFLSYVRSLGEVVEPYHLFPPDIVLFKDGNGVLGAGIYVGNGLILSSFVGDKISLVHRDSYNIEVVIKWAVAEQEE